MGKVMTDSQHYTDIANAIREKNGSSDTYLPSQMAGAIRALDASGGTAQTELFVLGADEVQGTSMTFTRPIQGVYCFIDCRNNVISDYGCEWGTITESDTNAEVVYMSVEKAAQDGFYYLAYTGSTSYPVTLTANSIEFIDPYGSKYYVLAVYA